MGERTFKLDGATFISCTKVCEKTCALIVKEDRIKELGGQTSTIRCIASGAPQRGQRFPLSEGHSQRPKINRVCTIYTEVDKG